MHGTLKAIDARKLAEENRKQKRKYYIASITKIHTTGENYRCSQMTPDTPKRGYDETWTPS